MVLFSQIINSIFISSGIGLVVSGLFYYLFKAFLKLSRYNIESSRYDANFVRIFLLLSVILFLSINLFCLILLLIMKNLAV